jgi:hypothetical protein
MRSCWGIRISVSDPYSFDTDPDPTFKAEYGSGFDPDPGLLMTKNLKYLQLGKKLYF